MKIFCGYHLCTNQLPEGAGAVVYQLACEANQEPRSQYCSEKCAEDASELYYDKPAKAIRRPPLNSHQFNGA